ncbi:cytochrome c biogenesis protein CcsA [Azoarcus sp. DN11]|uniref:cytochrome c biogenesis protein CcsA n=1 Tax=Azoarcus sp. DN11 TaxID=356837 RepID=UPI000EB0C164|nr:cytochrome c biogenesis protein CcsA [Azoarcus sp. DN11]AYH42047.1 heme ABC transporter permease [Azoarcus sp. DN11]
MPAFSSALRSDDPPLLTTWSAATPQRGYALATRLYPWFGWAAVVLCTLGLFVGLVLAPTDPHQHEHYRIAFIHTPALWLSVAIYFATAIAAGCSLARRQRFLSMFASALAPTGAMFAFLALWTGSLWGKPIWGTWWIWETRLTAELLVLFLFLGYIALQEAIDDARRADRASGLLALVGAFGLPLLYFSIIHWSAMYGNAPRGLAAPGNPIITMGLLLMGLGLFAYTVAATLARLRNVILKRERNSEWVARNFGARS